MSGVRRSRNVSSDLWLSRTAFLPPVPQQGRLPHHFVFSQGRRLAACQSPVLGSQVLTKHRPEQEGGARGSTRASGSCAPSPGSPPPPAMSRVAGAAVADNSKLLPPLLGRQWVTL